MSLPGRLTIDLEALTDNWRRLARECAPAACGGVVKADAYGIGVEHAAPALYRAGARIFFVAHLSEGARVREALGAGPKIYALNGFEATAEVGDYAQADVAPVIGGPSELARWDRARPFALHIDTGMNRLGLSFAELEAAKTCGPALLMSHFVSSEAPEDPLNARQIAAFAKARALFPTVPASLANSSGVFLPARPHYDLVRPGYALYGGNPTPGRENPMRPVVTLEVAVQQTRWIEPGETCGYNARWTARRRTRLATLPAGYADGLPFGYHCLWWDGRASLSRPGSGRPAPAARLFGDFVGLAQGCGPAGGEVSLGAPVSDPARSRWCSSFSLSSRRTV